MLIKMIQFQIKKNIAKIILIPHRTVDRFTYVLQIYIWNKEMVFSESAQKANIFAISMKAFGANIIDNETKRKNTR